VLAAHYEDQRMPRSVRSVQRRSPPHGAVHGTHQTAHAPYHPALVREQQAGIPQQRCHLLPTVPATPWPQRVNATRSAPKPAPRGSSPLPAKRPTPSIDWLAGMRGTHAHLCAPGSANQECHRTSIDRARRQCTPSGPTLLPGRAWERTGVPFMGVVELLDQLGGQGRGPPGRPIEYRGEDPTEQHHPYTDVIAPTSRPVQWLPQTRTQTNCRPPRPTPEPPASNHPPP